MKRDLDLKRHFAWTGDLDDNCLCRWNGMTAHCERMSDGKQPKRVTARNYLDGESWHFTVNGDRECLMHWVQDDLRAITGRAARMVCEWFMVQHLAREGGR